MIDFLSALPLWLLAIILNVWLIGFALAGLWFAQRRVFSRLRLSYEDAYVAAAVSQSAMVLYGLIAALTAVGVWQKYSAVSDIVSDEATAIASLWRDLSGYPEPQRAATQDILRGYTQQIINEAWPQQRRGETPSGGVEWIDRLQTPLLAFEPATEGQKILHAETLRAFNHLIQQRRLRVDSVQTSLPVVFWWVLLPGAMGSIALFLLFHLASRRFHAILLTGLAAFQALVLLIIIALARPFSGEMGIDSGSYELVYDHLMTQ